MATNHSPCLRVEQKHLPSILTTFYRPRTADCIWSFPYLPHSSYDHFRQIFTKWKIKAKTHLNSTLSPAIDDPLDYRLGFSRWAPQRSYTLPGRSLTAVWTSPDNCNSKQMTLTSKPNWTKSFNSNALMFDPPGSPKDGRRLFYFFISHDAFIQLMKQSHRQR